MAEPDDNEEFLAAPQAISSSQARELCDSRKATLLSALPPLADFAAPLDVDDLQDAVLEMNWLHVAKNQGAHCQFDSTAEFCCSA